MGLVIMKMLIVGINGILGHKFAEVARKDFSVVGTYRKFRLNDVEDYLKIMKEDEAR